MIIQLFQEELVEPAGESSGKEVRDSAGLGGGRS